MYFVLGFHPVYVAMSRSFFDIVGNGGASAAPLMRCSTVRSTGRRNHNEWSGFDAVPLATGRTGAKCRKCRHVFPNTAKERLKNHRSKCTGPENDIVNTETVVIVNEDEDVDGHVTADPKVIPASAPFQVPTTPGPSKKRKMTAFVDTVSEKQQEVLESKVAAFIFKCNLPFSVVEDPAFVDMLFEFRPAFQPPSRKEVAGRLLDKLYKLETAACQRKVEGSENGVILLDGWKNSSSNAKLVVALLQVGDEYVLLQSYNISEMGETADTLATVATNAATVAKDQYNVDVKVIVTDNASNMVSMGDKVSERFLHSRCNAHIANLLLKDIWKHYKYNETMDKILPVMKEFKKAGLAKELKERKGHAVQLPIDVRWCSNRDSTENFVNNLRIFRTMAGEGKITDTNLISTIFDTQVEEKCKAILDKLNPVCKVLNICQRSETTIAMAIDLWRELQINCIDTQMAKIVAERMDKSKVYAPAGLCANILDPLYRGSKLTTLQKNEAVDYLMKPFSGEEIESLNDYLFKKDRFKQLLGKKVSSSAFWDLAGYDPRNVSLAKMAKLYLSIPASTAQLERVFSNWANVHTKIRNRLGDTKSEKLTFIYFSHKVNKTSHIYVPDEEDEDLMYW